MKKLGNNILVKPNPRNTTTKSGIIIPETAALPSQEWGVVEEGNDLVEDGLRVLYLGDKLFVDEGIKVVPVNRLLYWV